MYNVAQTDSLQVLIKRGHLLLPLLCTCTCILLFFSALLWSHAVMTNPISFVNTSIVC